MAAPGAEPAEAAVSRRVPSTVVSVDARSNLGGVSTGLLGVNHRFVSDGHGMWDREADAPRPLIVQRLRQAGVEIVRYPGGTVGNLFDWKDSIGPERGCQVHGIGRRGSFRRVAGNAYGLDEHMELVEAAGARALIMVPYVTESPGDAADWVEYMNSPADGSLSNPNGGVDWAEKRAENGHPRPYGVRHWEIGNEQRLPTQRYWMSADTPTALRQYANGGQKRVVGEFLGKDCRHPVTGAVSGGGPGQVFDVLYPPVLPGSMTAQVVGEGAEVWRAGTLAEAGPADPVFEIDEASGQVRFGDGVHGAVLPRGLRVQASYVSDHKGVFSFINAMRAVDKNIEVCPAWGLRDFIQVAGRRPYSCFAAHAYSNFVQERTFAWQSAVQGHDYHMIGTHLERNAIARLQSELPSGVRVALTEFGAIWGNSAAYPRWDSSMTRATYMASMWVNWLGLGVRTAIGGDLLAPSHRGLFGPRPEFAVSAEALTRQAIRPMLSAGRNRVRVRTVGNPVRRAQVRAGMLSTYPALSVAAVKARNRDLYVLVVNRLPHNTDRVRARVALRGFASRRVAYVTRVNGSSFRSHNTATGQQVQLTRSRVRIGRDAFTHVFPAHSVTVLHVPRR